jgi:integrase
MSGHGFSSAFASRLDAYLTFKAAMGIGGSTRVWYLKSFDAWCAERGRDVLDRDTVEGWVTWLLSSSGQTRSWMSYIRDFGRWSRAHGDADAYVLSDRWKAPFRPAHPYLLSQLQIESFFTAAARLRTRSPWRWQAVAFFTLMHSCGLRTGEVLALHTADVDLTGRHVDVLWSKGNRSRRLPVTGDVTAVLTACDGASQARFGPSRKTFFVSSTGNPVTGATVGVVFNRIWDQAGLPRPAGGARPRPYDLRHHFAYANIDRWMADGTDTAAMLPYLSAYMGHAALASTYYYIHTSPDFMTGYATITAVNSGLLPEVGFA